MKELWVQKTIWRRYLIDDNDVFDVVQTLNGDPERGDEIVADCYNVNEDVEYDNEIVILPIQFKIQDCKCT